MDRVDFKCTLLGDVVIHADANTEGNIPLHDYIPGSNFLGIVARKYESFGDDSFDIFHGGKVRFGDAHPVVGNEYALRPPFSWHFPKGEGVTEKALYNILEMDESQRKGLVKENIQLKQLRNGFFAPDANVYVKIAHHYSQKSAYDRQTRRSKDASMFGYSSLPAGLVLGFSVVFDERIDTELRKRIVSILEGKHRLGKSRSAQYGMVSIERCASWPSPSTAPGPKGSFLLYARSRLAFVDKEGNPTLQPDHISLNLPESASVNWRKSQIRTASFAPYNGARRTRDYRRSYIDKGSVIVVEGLPEDFDGTKWLDDQGGAVGIWRSEGFGEVLLNPAFLYEERIALHTETGSNSHKIPRRKNEHLSRWLANRHERKQNELKILALIKSFLDAHSHLYTGVNPSQWGALRAFCQEENFLKKIEEYIGKGTASKQQWEGERKRILLDTLKKMNKEKSRLFLQLLATEMAKAIRRKRGDG